MQEENSNIPYEESMPSTEEENFLFKKAQGIAYTLSKSPHFDKATRFVYSFAEDGVSYVFWCHGRRLCKITILKPAHDNVDPDLVLDCLRNSKRFLN